MTRLSLLAALAALLTPLPALAEPFVLLIHETPAQIALRDDPGPDGAAYWGSYAAFAAAAQAAGILRGGAAMRPGDAPAQGPILGGFFQIDVADAAEAALWAARLPAAASVEVRAAISAPGM